MSLCCFFYTLWKHRFLYQGQIITSPPLSAPTYLKNTGDLSFSVMESQTVCLNQIFALQVQKKKDQEKGLPYHHCCGGRQQSRIQEGDWDKYTLSPYDGAWCCRRGRFPHKSIIIRRAEVQFFAVQSQSSTNSEVRSKIGRGSCKDIRNGTVKKLSAAAFQEFSALG